ncbi:MAG: hypothetical protein NVSMB4_02360 [Acidimicrobiales bacterium]
MCDTVYVLMLSRVEREALAVRTGLIARGVVDDLPSVDDALVEFDAQLAAPPEVRSTNSEMYERLRAAG